ncbi:MAG: thioredoxin family protein [Acidobacteriota bacterium]
MSKDRFWLSRTLPFALLAATVFCSSSNSSPPDQAPVVEAEESLESLIDWQNFEAALLDDAKQEGRPVMIYFHADWCVPCVELDRYTFSDEAVAELADSFVRTKVDWTDYASVDDNLDPDAAFLKEQYTIYGLPTILFIDGEGNEVAESRVIGFLDPEDFVLQMERALPAS